MVRARAGAASGASLLEAERRRRERARRASGLRAPARRAIFFLAFLCTGLVIGRGFLAGFCGEAGSFGVFLAGGLCALVGMCARGRWSRAALGIGVVCAGAGWWMLRVVERPADDVARVLGDRPALVTVEGMVAESPRVMSTQRGALARFARHARRVARFELRVARVVGAEGASRPASGRLSVRVDGPMVGAGDDSFAGALPGAGRWVRVTGLATGVRGPRNPGETDFRPIAAARGISGSVRCASADLVEEIEGEGGMVWGVRSGWAGWVAGMRGGARRVLRRVVGEESSRREALLGALLLGERDGRYHELSAPFVRLGVTHVLAISGLHVGIFAGAIALLVRLTGDRWRVESLVVLAAVALMLVLIPARAPVVRACAIIAGFVVAGLAGRRYDALNTLGWVAAGVLLWRPTELWNPGFQLSFLIVGALIVLTGPVRERVFGVKRDPDHRGGWERVRYGVEDALCASGCAWLVSLPLVAHHFGVVTVYAPVVSLLVLPLVGALLVVGYGVVAVGWMWAEVGGGAGVVLDWMAGWLLDGVVALDGLPWSTLRVPEVGWVWALAGTGVVWVWLWGGVGRGWRIGLDGWRVGRPGRWVRAGWVALVAVVAGWPVLLVGRGVVLGDPSGPGTPGLAPILRWDVFDVGDGSAHVVRAGGGALMFDCGSSWYGIGERVIPEGARASGAWRIPTVVISHPDGDHYSGLLDCVEPLGIERVLVGGAFMEEGKRRSDEATERRREEKVGRAGFVLGELGRLGVEVAEVWAGDVVELGDGGATVEFLSPRRGFGWERDNDASLVALVTVPPEAGADAGVRPVRLLLTGDIERDAMDEVEAALAARGVAEVDGMEAPHHGSAREFAFGFVDRLSPRVVVQSTGVSRLGDERWDSVKEAIEQWWITARDGGVSVWLYGDGSVWARGWRAD